MLFFFCFCFFFQAGQGAALSSFRITKKWHFSGKRVGFLKSDKKTLYTGNHYWTVAEIFNSLKEDTICKNIAKMGTFCGEHSEKGISLWYFEHTV